VYGDAVLLHQLGYNLLDNAIKYTPAGGLVELSFVAGEKGLRLVVRDTGLGIEEEEQRRIFDRFYRGDKARSHGEGGTGLGLALVKQIAEVHHGTVEVASVAGEGSSFAVTFPVASDATRGPSQVSGMSVAERTRS
jgi:two-component system phosphate regulon sensor histidine kinase PhoR